MMKENIKKQILESAKIKNEMAKYYSKKTFVHICKLIYKT